MSAVYVVTNRVVFTYQPSGWPVGVITGREEGGTFHVEHVVVFPGAPWSTLMRMLRAGLAEAWARGYERVAFCLPDGFVLAPALAKLGRRLGFGECSGRYWLDLKTDTRTLPDNPPAAASADRGSGAPRVTLDGPFQRMACVHAASVA